MIGEKFGRLEVIEAAGISRHRARLWLCRCDCGKTSTLSTGDLRRGHTQSCGCLHRQMTSAAVTTHGKSHTPVYRIYYAMMQRCSDESRPEYHRYGGRGIRVCERWHRFENFYADMGDPPPGLTLERTDNDGPYSPENCRWATRAEQGANTSRVRLVKINGVDMPFQAACKQLGLRPNTVYMRIHRGSTMEEALR